MKLEQPIAWARSCKNKRDAAVVACTLETEISAGNVHDEHWYDQADTALAYLREHYPGFWELDAYQAPPSLSEGFRKAERSTDEDVQRAPEVLRPPIPTVQKNHPTPAQRPAFSTGKTLACILVIMSVIAANMIPGPTATAATGKAISPSWQQFQSDCQSGPSAGQGYTASQCQCWETHLESASILPDDAVDILLAGQAGGGERFMVAENIGNTSVHAAMGACGIG